MNRSVLEDYLHEKSPLILDGAMATELEKRGLALNNALWSASVIADYPQAIRDVHQSYFRAGADIVTTNTYQATIAGFQKAGIGVDKGRQLIQQAVAAAKEARQQFWTSDGGAQRLFPLIAGSVGPYGAFLADGSEYTGNYALEKAAFQSFHFSRMDALVEAGVDLFAFETMPNFAEVQALVDLLEKRFADRSGWVSFSLADPEHLCDGTPLADAAEWTGAHAAVAAVGVNCLPIDSVDQALTSLRAATDKPLLVYPNSGERYDPLTKTWHHPSKSVDFAACAAQWQQSGASLIGGCCRTTPEDIAAITQTFHT